MAVVATSARLGVSVYLLKKSRIFEAHKQLTIAGEKVFPLAERIPEGLFISLPSLAEPPKWLDPISALIANGAAPALESQSPGAILWVPRGEKTFVFTFGYGHSKVTDEWVVPDFGKIVALAVVPQGQVREVRAEQVFAKRHIASERAPRASAVREFGFEPDRDLVSAVEGVPESTHWALLGKKVRGGVSFRFELDVDQLIDTLDRLAERFDSNDHLSRWPQASNLVAVRDADRIDELDALLDIELGKSGASASIALAAPSERSGEKPYPQHFVIGRMGKVPATSPYLSFAGWQSYLKSAGTVPALETAKSTRVHLLDEDKSEIESCSMYECFGAEVSKDGTNYVLSSGHWYAAELHFIDSTNATLSTLVPPGHGLSKWNRTDQEGPYNAGACVADTSLWLFDKELVYFGGGASSFEFCDIMHWPTRTLYFVKHPTRSAGVSHLCEQVRRTAETFFSMDARYREKLAERIAKLGKGWDVSWLLAQPKRHEWQLCLVLMGKQASALPLFAKCGIARLLGELQRGGYNVSFQAV